MPGIAHSPELSEDEGRSSEGDAVASSKRTEESDEGRSWADEDDVGSGGESLVIGPARLTLP